MLGSDSAVGHVFTRNVWSGLCLVKCRERKKVLEIVLCKCFLLAQEFVFFRTMGEGDRSARRSRIASDVKRLQALLESPFFKAGVVNKSAKLLTLVQVQGTK